MRDSGWEREKKIGSDRQRKRVQQVDREKSTTHCIIFMIHLKKTHTHRDEALFSSVLSNLDAHTGTKTAVHSEIAVFLKFTSKEVGRLMLNIKLESVCVPKNVFDLETGVCVAPRLCVAIQ